MALQHYVLKIFLMYISLKAALFLPVCWYLFLRWWAGRAERDVCVGISHDSATEPA